LSLPTRYSRSDDFHSLDLRLTRSFVLRERYRFSLIAEVFNLYNADLPSLRPRNAGRVQMVHLEKRLWVSGPMNL
jgi:hypothetical protein